MRALLAPGAVLCMIGDNPDADIRGAQAAGIPALLVRGQAPGLVGCADLTEVHARLAALFG